ncbi:sulfatase [Lutimonas saemankumensis]|uniref:sulfatase family protein n=1 Tax=Lutimonas saemankumensis TaxID=483016 RepID=UPI001CD2F59D|nr:sulfatase [Lutimonas saemankumensis]MCA0932505.1 sulfatase [Lutimonas saemankumensis]
MKKYSMLSFLLIGIFFATCSTKGQKGQDDQSAKIKPNILFLLAEDISTDLECYGMQGVKTPVLNQLASDGIQFMNAYGNNSICSPSRSNMMVGVHQNISNTQHHRSNRDIPLMEPYKPITSYLRDAGYTCIIGSNLVRQNGQKIDVNFKHTMIGEWDGKNNFGLFDKKHEVLPEDQPFFQQVTLHVTHRGGWWNGVRAQSKHKVDPAAVSLPPYYADTPVIREDWAKYLDQMEYMDNEVGLLLKDLEAKGMRDNTIIIFIGDNGRCNVRGKGYLYEPGLHLPLIVNWPAALTGGKKEERLVASVDVAATILHAAGVEIPDYMTARSIIKEDNEPREYVYSARDLWDEILEQSRAITTTEYRYIKNNITDQSYDAHQAYLEFYRPAVHVMRGLNEKNELTELQSKFFEPTKPKEELYDRINDPYETVNLIDHPEYQAVADKMRGYYEDWNTENHDYGLEEIIWENCPPPKSVEIMEWLNKERPEVIAKMKKGIEPGYGKLNKEYQKAQKNQEKSN